ncbi:MAG: AgmX/PglI C-terminal domain-containing protein [Polyangiaceae bacterium]|nr:AgmX/PglI C-terminal domain-containing protein [Polyangiaceae bacterium]MCW5791152.1 AgmX/PglI C-terminal domain-containing protein [Polyangiaceae bacterium]
MPGEPALGAVTPEPEPPLPEIEWVVEPPHLPGARPRPEGRVAAAGHDEDLARWNLGGVSDPDYPSSRANYHPGARVVVDVAQVTGGLPKTAPRGQGPRKPSEQGLLAHARKWGYWPFRICFEAAVRRTPTAHGQTKLRLVLNAAGKVVHSELLGSALDDEAAACLAQAARDYRPFSPAPGRRVQLELSVKLWPGDAPLPFLAESEQRAALASENPGQLSAEALLAASEPALAASRRCFAEGVQRDPALWGRLQLELQILPRGGVAKVRQSDSRFPDPKVVRCVRRAFREVQYPAPDGGRVTWMLGLRLPARPAPEPEPSPDATEVAEGGSAHEP